MERGGQQGGGRGKNEKNLKYILFFLKHKVSYLCYAFVSVTYLREQKKN